MQLDLPQRIDREGNGCAQQYCVGIAEMVDDHQRGSLFGIVLHAFLRALHGQ
jgi:hypothetical protein